MLLAAIQIPNVVNLSDSHLRVSHNEDGDASNWPLNYS